jgi:NAD(P)H dehydrogenase (quinone)
MASAVVAGAQTVENVRVLLRSVDEVSIEEVIEARGIIVGSPVYNAAVAPKVQEFINSWPFAGGEMRDKIGAAFVTGGGISAGEELVQVSLLHSMMIFGMIVVGGEEWTSAFGASAVTEEGGYRRAAKGEVDEAFLKKAESIGRRVALLVRKLNTS